MSVMFFGYTYNLKKSNTVPASWEMPNHKKAQPKQNWGQCPPIYV